MKCIICGEPATAIVIGKEKKGYCKLHISELKLEWEHERQLKKLEWETWLSQLQKQYGEKHA